MWMPNKLIDFIKMQKEKEKLKCPMCNSAYVLKYLYHDVWHCSDCCAEFDKKPGLIPSPEGFHCNNKGLHFSDPGYKGVCATQCEACKDYGACSF